MKIFSRKWSIKLHQLYNLFAKSVHNNMSFLINNDITNNAVKAKDSN